MTLLVALGFTSPKVYPTLLIFKDNKSSATVLLDVPMHGGQPFLLYVCLVLRQSFEQSLDYQLHIFYCPSHVGIK